MKRHRGDPVETAIHRQTADVSAGLPLWAETPAPSKPSWASTYTKAERNRDIERLVPLAQELAQKAGKHGVTVSNLRFAAIKDGLLTGEEQGRRLSFLGKVMHAAGLVSTGQYRRSDIAKSHGNIQLIWTLAEFAPQQERAG